MTFMSNDQYYDGIHGVVCLNVSILYTCIHHRMETNDAEESFHFLYTKNIFYFSSAKMGFFVTHLPACQGAVVGPACLVGGGVGPACLVGPGEWDRSD